MQPRQLGVTAGAARAAHDEQHRSVVAQAGERAHREIGALELLDAAGEEEHGSSGDAERALGDVAVAGDEQRGVDALRHDLDAVGIGAVEADELLPLVGGRRDDEIGAAHDLRLDAGPEVDVVVDPHLGLHPVERVERGDERQPELVLEAMPHRARHPVVGVDDVVGRAAALERVACGVGEGADELGELAARHRRARPGLDVEHAEARLDHDDGRLFGVLGTGEDVDLHAGTGERGRERADVDVHPTGVAAPRLCKR